MIQIQICPFTQKPGIQVTVGLHKWANILTVAVAISDFSSLIGFLQLNVQVFYWQEKKSKYSAQS